MRKWLIELRKGKCLTQQEVADEIGVSRTAYAMYEQGQRNPAVKTAKKSRGIFIFRLDKIFRMISYEMCHLKSCYKMSKRGYKINQGPL